MSLVAHRVRRLRWTLHAASTEQALALRRDIREQLDDRLLPALERALDAVDTDGEVMHVPRLELTVRVDSTEALRRDLAEQVERELVDALRRLERESVDQRPVRRTLAEARRDELWRYLETGSAPTLGHAPRAELLARAREHRAATLEFLARRSAVAWFRWLALAETHAVADAALRYLLPFDVGDADTSATASLQAALESIVTRLLVDAPTLAHHVRLSMAAELLSASGRGDTTAVRELIKQARRVISSEPLRAGESTASPPSIAAQQHRGEAASIAQPSSSPGTHEPEGSARPSDVARLLPSSDAASRESSAVGAAREIGEPTTLRDHEPAAVRESTSRDPTMLREQTAPHEPTTLREPATLREPMTLTDEPTTLGEFATVGGPTPLGEPALDESARSSPRVDARTHAPSTGRPVEARDTTPRPRSTTDEPTTAVAITPESTSTTPHQHTRLEPHTNRGATLGELARPRLADRQLGEAAPDSTARTSSATADAAAPPAVPTDLQTAHAPAASHSATSVHEPSSSSHTSLQPASTTTEPLAPHITPPWLSLRTPATLATPVACAGLVLLHPFIPTLFARVGLAPSGRAPLPDASLPIAAALLHHLATGDTAPLEPQLGLVKHLLGLRIDTPLLVGDDLLDARVRDEAEQVLRAAIDHWRALGQISVAGFRATFLQRNGLVRELSAGASLTVEPGPFDMLLDRLPWGLSIVKFPWMPRPLFVEWTPT